MESAMRSLILLELYLQTNWGKRIRYHISARCWFFKM